MQPAKSTIVSQIAPIQQSGQPTDAEREIRRLREELDRMRALAGKVEKHPTESRCKKLPSATAEVNITK